MRTATEKTCWKCKAMVPLEGFHRRKSASDGRVDACKPCANQISREHRAANIERLRAYDHARPRVNTAWRAARDARRAVVVESALAGSPSKVCTKCGRTKPIGEFNLQTLNRDGHTSRCKGCTSAHMLGYYDANRDARIAASRARPDSQDRRYSTRAALKRWYQSNRHKSRAHRITNDAIAQGRLTRKPCEVCGAKAEAHHDDYSKPLDVRWLCRIHHKEHHRMEFRARVKRGEAVRA